MNKATLVIMAAGIGSRYGQGIKQLASVGPNEEVIMDYSIYDAIQAGFDKVVFIIRRDLEKDFKERIGNRVAKIVKVVYVYQELSDVPEGFRNKLEKRIKPWGTGQAILCCKEVVKEPFLVINADDYYGREAYGVVYDYLLEEQKNSEGLHIGMVGFVLKNTLSENGTVTRGICRVDKNHMLTEIEETYGIEKKNGRALSEQNGKVVELSLDSPVSMNMWALTPEFFSVLENGFRRFLQGLDQEDIKSEYLLPEIIGDLVRNEKAQVKVLESKDKWFGVTYQEDREIVINSIRMLIERGEYPEQLF